MVSSVLYSILTENSYGAVVKENTMTQPNEQIKKIVLTGLMTGLVFLATSIIKIPTMNGYIHLETASYLYQL